MEQKMKQSQPLNILFKILDNSLTTTKTFKHIKKCSEPKT